ncbi:MAG TPA: hypothetical protein VHX88_11455 [Solirubrobacteraceae bacterium]|nr:hypothetical protein [Solirubrobacteraceae bacterium]
MSDLLSTVTSLPGFRDAYVAVSRQRGQVSVFTVWDSEKAMQDSEVAAASGVTEAVGGIGGYDETPAVERFEVVKHETW